MKCVECGKETIKPIKNKCKACYHKLYQIEYERRPDVIERRKTYKIQYDHIRALRGQLARRINKINELVRYSKHTKIDIEKLAMYTKIKNDLKGVKVYEP